MMRYSRLGSVSNVLTEKGLYMFNFSPATKSRHMFLFETYAYFCEWKLDSNNGEGISFRVVYSEAWNAKPGATEFSWICQ
jgi:hypothetical protein